MLRDRRSRGYATVRFDRPYSLSGNPYTARLRHAGDTGSTASKASWSVPDTVLGPIPTASTAARARPRILDSGRVSGEPWL
jgi:hypothetical protein